MAQKYKASRRTILGYGSFKGKENIGKWSLYMVLQQEYTEQPGGRMKVRGTREMMGKGERDDAQRRRLHATKRNFADTKDK